MTVGREREGRCGTSSVAVRSGSKETLVSAQGEQEQPDGRSRAVATGAGVTLAARVGDRMPLDEFDAEGVQRMDDDEMTSFLSSQHVGVLALPTDGAPTVRPLSFWFDGDESVYFHYVGAGGRKASLSDRADIARFLVYRAETRYNWRSVILTGTIDEVPGSEVAAVTEAIDLGQRLDAVERTGESAETTLYRFAVTERTGVSHVGLPSGFEPDAQEE